MPSRRRCSSMSARAVFWRKAMFCVALPTCGIVLTESERYLPELLDALEQRLGVCGLTEGFIAAAVNGTDFHKDTGAQR
jgi:sulfite reductase beta subunit-like hemoprotein